MSSIVSPWVARWAPSAPQGKVLDLACGMGRHAHLLAALGHPVLAVDRDASALIHAAGDAIVTVQVDLEGDDDGAAAQRALLLKPQQFAAIVVTNYLHRPLMGALLASLAEDGMLIYETFAVGNEAYGKPSNPAFLLQPDELLRMVQASGLRVLAFEQGYVNTPKPAVVQRICAIAPAFVLANVKLDV
ncbi:MAG: SAM-dependent methyltransferase [Bdellovibrionales bacterium]|nr:SAM-dependent methyltransferase [Massilia sp.]